MGLCCPPAHDLTLAASVVGSRCVQELQLLLMRMSLSISPRACHFATARSNLVKHD